MRNQKQDSKILTSMYYLNLNVGLMSKNVTQIKNGIKINIGANVKISHKNYECKKIYIWNSATCSCKNGRFAGIIISDAVIMCGEIIEEKKSTSTNFNEKK